MSGSSKEFYYKELSYELLAICFKVHSKVGIGLPEWVYNRALEVECNRRKIPCTLQEQFDVYYYGKRVGHFISDLVVDNKIILELKTDEHGFKPGHMSQLFTYLRVSRLKVGYLLNFGTPSLQFKRLIL